MPGINKIILIGNLGRDPELRQTQGGNAVCEFSIAVNETWYDKDKKKQERVEWLAITAWGKLAEICSKHLSKGRQVYVEGKLRTRSWDDKNGGKRYKTEVVAETVQFLGGPNSGNGQRQQQKQDEWDPDPGPEDDLPF
jgi:single-strand DNA-binding protein